MASKKVTAPPIKRTAVIYARYSSHNQREESIEQQVEECRAFAATNNLNVIEVYADKAISGRTDRRNSFQRLLRDAEKHKFQVVIAYKSNRIARNMLNALQYESKLDAFGIKTFYVKEEFGNNAAGRFALRTMMNINQFYSENLAEDVKRGLRDNASQCKVNGVLPLGYCRGSDGHYMIEPNEAAIVREIFGKVLQGMPLAEIANDLNARCIHTKRGGRWNKNSFHIMLANRNYIGVYHYADIEIEDGIPPIISREVFVAVQEKMGENGSNCRRKNADYLLTGKLYCGHCNSFMVGVSGTGKHGDVHYYYACQGRRGGNGCQKKNVQRDWLERRITEVTKENVLQDDIIEWIAKSAVAFQQEALQDSDITYLEQEISNQRRAQKNIMNAIEAGIYTATTKDRLIEIETSLAGLSRKLAAEKSKFRPVDKDWIIYNLNKFKDGNVADKHYQKSVIDSFVRAVYLYDDYVKVEYYYAGKDSTINFPLDGKNSEPDSPASEFAQTPLGSATRALGEPQPYIYFTAGAFVLICPLNYRP